MHLRQFQRLTVRLVLALQLFYCNPAELAAYIKKYPDGQFIELARIRQRVLENQKSMTPQPEAVPTPTPRPTAEMNQEQPKPTPEQPAQSNAQSVGSVPPGEQASAPPKSAEPDSPTTLAETIDWIKRYFPTKFTYQFTTVNAAGGASPILREATVDVELIRFEGCKLEWRDGADRLSVSLSDLDPQNVKVELRQKPDINLNMEIWNVSLTATNGHDAFRETKGDDGAENRYNGVDLQYGDQAIANKLARALQRAIKLCGGKPAPN